MPADRLMAALEIQSPCGTAASTVAVLMVVIAARNGVVVMRMRTLASLARSERTAGAAGQA